MRPVYAYALLGLAWIVIGGGVYFYVNHRVVPLGTDSQPAMTGGFSLSSSAFADGMSIPSRFTCDGAQTSPHLVISSVPAQAKSLVLIMADPDVSKQLKADGIFDHWILFNIPPETIEIPEGGTVGTPGVNGAGKNAYAAPCPPPQYEPSEHRYIFALFALDTTLALNPGASKTDILAAMEGHILAQTELTGKYQRH